MDAAVLSVEKSCLAVVAVLLIAAVVSAVQMRAALATIEHRTQIGKALLDGSVAAARSKATALERPEATARAEAAIEEAAQADREKFQLPVPQESRKTRRVKSTSNRYPVRDRLVSGGW